MSTHDPASPPRLADHGDRLNGIVRSALEAERQDGPDAARLDAIAARLAARLAVPAAVAEPAPPSPPVPPAPPSARSWRGVAAAAAALGVGIGIAALVASRTPAPPVNTPPTTTNPAPVVTAAAPGPATPTTLPTLTTAESPAVPTFSPSDLPTAREPLALAPSAPSAQGPKLPPSPSPAPPSPPVAGGDGEEIALLARAHETLATSPAASLALCREHEQRFPSPHFAQEREAVAIEALVYLGQKAEATRRFDAFRTSHPTSSHRAHLEDLLAGSRSPR